MEHIEALTYGAALLAFIAGIVVALTFTFGPVITTSLAAFWINILHFSPFTSSLFTATLVGDLGMNAVALQIGVAMLLAYGVATAATLTFNLVRGRVNGGFPPFAG
jgi:hypothetical protein